MPHGRGKLSKLGRPTKVKSLNTTIKSAVLGLLVLAAFSASGAALEQNATESATVDVTVQSDVAVDVHPTNLAYTDATVGSQDNKSDSGYASVDVYNTGSLYIDRIWLNTSTPSSDPFGTGSANSYNAGNFFMVKPNNASELLNGDSTNYHYVNRVEFTHNLSQDSEVPSYLDTTPIQSVNYGANDKGVYTGRFRVGSKDYMFVIASGTSGTSTCDSTSGSPVLRVANTPQTDTQVGTTDFSDSGTDYTQYNITSQVGTYGIADDVPAGQAGVVLGNREYDVLTKCQVNNAEAIRTRYNVEAGDASDLATNGARTQFLLSGDTASTQLEPGSTVTFDTAVQVPRGVAAGSVTQGDITVVISADSGTSTS